MPPTKNRSILHPVLLAILALSIYAAGLIHGRYLSHGRSLTAIAKGSGSEVGSDDHAGHAHSHTSENSIELSEAARKNVGLTDEYLQPIELRDFDKTVSVPAIVVDRPGRTRLPVSAATTGIITHVHAVTGEAVSSGDLILEMRLTHEDLVTAQREFLQALGDRDVEMKEIARIEIAANSGVISNKTLLDRQYSRDKIDSLLKSQREALRLHGLSEAQITTIETDRRLLTEIKVYAPDPDSHKTDELQLSRRESTSVAIDLDHHYESIPSNDSQSLIRVVSVHKPLDQSSNQTVESVKKEVDHEHPSNKNRLLVLQDLHVQKGQVVNAGELLCVLADFGDLLIEGQAFETEAGLLSKTKQAGWSVSAVTEAAGRPITLTGLTLSWLDNEIDPVSRALKFYVRLPNTVDGENTNQDGQRHITWRYRTGQRMQLLVPVEKWTEQIVLPVDAVVREGIESFVFQQNGDQYDRVAVHERFRDQSSVVIENDGSIYPGDIVALRGAHQLQMALKNKAGGAIDPHAGHSH